MAAPFKPMRVIFEIKEITCNMPANVRKCEVGAEFQIQPCSIMNSIEKEFKLRQFNCLEKPYVGKVKEFNKILPADLQ